MIYKKCLILSFLMCSLHAMQLQNSQIASYDEQELNVNRASEKLWEVLGKFMRQQATEQEVILNNRHYQSAYQEFIKFKS